MKSTSVDFLAALTATKGLEPIVIIGINFGTYTEYYADKSLQIPGGAYVDGRILKIDGLQILKQHDNYGAVGQLNVELDDTDLHLLNIINNILLEGLHANVYLYFPNMDDHELLILFSGVVSGPIGWSEGQHTLKFNIFSEYKDLNIGDVITSDDLEDDFGETVVLDKNAVGKMIPIAFGNLLKTQAFKLFIPRESVINENISLDDNYTREYVLANGIYPEFDFEVDRGEEWPQGVNTYFTVNDIEFFGRFDGNICTVLEHNVPTDMINAVCYRDSGDPDYHDFYTTWIPTDEKLVNKWVYFISPDPRVGRVINFCVQQNGQKCKFQSPLVAEYPNYLASTAQGIYNVELSGAVAIQCALKYNYNWPKLTNIDFFEQYVLPEGSPIVAIASEQYVVNDLADGNVKAVWAYREIPNEIFNPEIDQYEQRGTRRILSLVPSSYYTIDTIGYTSITFFKSLLRYQNEFWNIGEIFVTHSSPVGPNTAEIIQYLIETYTSLQIDPISFSNVIGYLEDYPSDFILTDSKKCMDACREIAWQARCALRVYNGFVYIIYLSRSSTYSYNLSEDLIKYKSMEVSFTDSDRLYTRAKATFKVPSFVKNIKEERVIVFEAQIALFGLRETTWDFYIYDNEDYVIKSANFWMGYYAYSYRKLKVTASLSALQLDLFDCILVNMNQIYPLGSNTRAIVEEINYDSNDHVVHLSLWTPVLAGTTTEDTGFWVSDSDGIDFVDPTAGISLLDYDVKVGTSQSKKNPKKYAIITSTDTEVDQNGTPTGNKTHSGIELPHGEENMEGLAVSGMRTVITLGTKILRGDIVRKKVVNGRDYIEQVMQEKVEFIIVDVLEDTLLCNHYDNGVLLEENIAIAKPYLLRRTPFDGFTRGDIAYEYAENVVRLAQSTTEVDENDDPLTEVQVIVPSYFMGDIIYASRSIKGMTLLYDLAGDRVGWIDINADGRAWAALPAE